VEKFSKSQTDAIAVPALSLQRFPHVGMIIQYPQINGAEQPVRQFADCDNAFIGVVGWVAVAIQHCGKFDCCVIFQSKEHFTSVDRRTLDIGDAGALIRIVIAGIVLDRRL
jgi:hypothetical protein